MIKIIDYFLKFVLNRIFNIIFSGILFVKSLVFFVVCWQPFMFVFLSLCLSLSLRIIQDKSLELQSRDSRFKLYRRGLS